MNGQNAKLNYIQTIHVLLLGNPSPELRRPKILFVWHMEWETNRPPTTSSIINLILSLPIWLDNLNGVFYILIVELTSAFIWSNSMAFLCPHVSPKHIPVNFTVITVHAVCGFESTTKHRVSTSILNQAFQPNKISQSFINRQTCICPFASLPLHPYPILLWLY